MKSIKYFLLANVIFGWNSIRAAITNPIKKETQFALGKGFFFEENNGQFPDRSVKYYGNSKGVFLFCKPGKISFVFTKVEKEPEQISEATGNPSFGSQSFVPQHKQDQRSSLAALRTSISTSRMDFVLIGSNPSAQINASSKQDYFENFYTTGNADSGITHVNTFKTVTYKDIYPHIDMILNVAKQGIEYSFLVHPGGKVSDIQLRWDGAGNSKSNGKGGFTYGDELGKIEEGGLRSFDHGKEIKSKFLRKENSYGFNVKKYDERKNLLIDPKLIWEEFYHGENNESGTDIAVDDSGFVYITGNTNSFNGIATKGAYQTSLAGYTDAFIAKFNKKGNLVWGTYFGGSGNDGGNVISVGNFGDIFIAGTTTSSGLATSGAGQTSSGNIFVSKFTVSGIRKWTTYYGGTSGYNTPKSGKCDKVGNFYIVGSAANSVATGMVTKGAYQGSINGSYDAFLAKFSSSGVLLMGTFYGGENNDNGEGISLDSSANIYITGNTQSSYGIAKGATYQTFNRAGPNSSNAFLAKFDSSGSFKWGTYYGDYYGAAANSVCADKNSGDIYITGVTNGNYYMATSGAYLTSNPGGQDAFLAKFSSSGTLIWGTFCGTNNYNGISVNTDNIGNVFLSTSAAGLQEFSSSGKFLWDTLEIAYGDEAATMDFFNNIYLLGGGRAIVSKWGNKSNYDAGISDLQVSGYNNCSDSELVKATLVNYGDVELDSVRIFLSINGQIQKLYYWKGNIGANSSFTVNLGNFIFNRALDSLKAWTISPDGFKDSVHDNDTAYIVDSIYSYPYAITGGNKAICTGNKITIGTSPTLGHSYSWLSIPSGFTTSLSNPVVSPTITTTYYLTETISNTSCKKIDSAKITVNPLPAPISNSPKSICESDSVSIGASAISGHAYSWTSVPSGFISSNAKNRVSPSTSTIYYLTETITASGCSNHDSALVTVHPLPPAKTTFNQAICQGDSIVIGYAYTTGDTYEWTSSPAGFHDTSSNPYVKPKTATTYLLKEITPFGCTKTGSVDITVNPIPADPEIRTKDSVCLGQSVKVQFHPASYINYVWSSIPVGYSSNDSIITVVPTTATDYILTQTIPSTDCFRNDTIKISVNPLPKPVIAGDSVICGVTKSDYIVADVKGDSYLWQVNGGKIISGQNAASLVIKWDSLKNVKLKLIETNSFGCSNSDTEIVYISNKPVAGFYFQDVCLGNPEYFQDSSTYAKSWSWNFGDSTVSNVENVYHVFQHAGSYRITQVVKNTVGCADTFIKTATVYPSPQVQWIIKRDTGRTILYAVADSLDAHYTWAFGDGDQGSNYYGSHYYTKDNIYYLSLKALNSYGCSAEMDTSISVDFYSQLQIGIFPNPFVDHLYINYSLSQTSNVGMILYDAIGKEVYPILNQVQNSGRYSYDMAAMEANLAPGIYFMKFILNGHVSVYKIVKED